MVLGYRAPASQGHVVLNVESVSSNFFWDVIIPT